MFDGVLDISGTFLSGEFVSRIKCEQTGTPAGVLRIRGC
jgi:hypothetical protein